MTEGQTPVTIIIPTCNPGDMIRTLLRALSIQRISPSPGVTTGGAPAILLVDSSSDPAPVKAVAAEFGVRFEQVGAEKFGHGRTRNRAAALCQTPFLAFFTQDALPADEHAIAHLLNAAMSDDKAAGAYARQLPRPEASARTAAEVTGWFTNGAAPVVQEVKDSAEWETLTPMARYLRARFDNVASLVRREVLEKIPFRDTYFGEDIEWGRDVLRAGYRIIYEPRAQVIHSHDRGALYEFERTVNCHARLHELFGLRTLPTFPSALRGMGTSFTEGLRQTWASPKSMGEKLAESARIPGREAARALGQWVGGVLGARGLAERFHFRGI